MIQERVTQVRARILAAAAAAGREATSVKLIGITKGVSAEHIQEALACGMDEMGENRIQEAQQKRLLIKGSVRWHLVGHLQRNKVKAAVDLFDVIHSVDSLELIEALDRQAATRRSKPLEVLIQVNVSGEVSKQGCRPEEMETLARTIMGAGNLRFSGLMTMAPYSRNPESARPVFRKLRELRDGLQEKFSNLQLTPDHLPLHLSMGMSQDFEAAVQEGATMVRIGTAIFGE